MAFNLSFHPLYLAGSAPRAKVSAFWLNPSISSKVDIIAASMGRSSCVFTAPLTDSIESTYNGVVQCLTISKGILGSMKTEDNEQEMGSREAAAYLGYTLGSFYTKVREIRHRKERGELFFSAEALDEFRAAQSVEHIPATEGVG